MTEKNDNDKDDPFKNDRRGIEQWRCGLCQSINDMADDECQGCHYDYDKDVDSHIVIKTRIKKETGISPGRDFVHTELYTTPKKKKSKSLLDLL